MNNTVNKDLVTGEQYKVKNIIVYDVKYTTYTYQGYSGYQKIANIGSGEGYYITNGYAVPITWTKKDRSSQTVYKYENGKEIDVNDGNTFNAGTYTFSYSGWTTIKYPSGARVTSSSFSYYNGTRLTY